MEKILLDSDIFIDALRYFEPATKFLKSLTESNAPVFFSAVTEAELISGQACADLAIKLKTLDMLSLFAKIPVTNKTAITAGDFRRTYGVTLQDSFIAATAFHLGAEVLTRNLQDFSKIKEISARRPY
ncbi:TPA: PIN domain-containing protein [archaeon]|nr:PIN domain-containing protein [Candidatus Naiadarchaeales archaeon SRR2090153.bin461]